MQISLPFFIFSKFFGSETCGVQKLAIHIIN